MEGQTASTLTVGVPREPMWLAFKGIFDDASDKTSDNVNKIGS